ncbi:uncharacterized protein LOC134792945 isoform X2 [Cydia splendana]|uniref:uncharacterized protein LOC134792945 isoform X2 n=1 Tax=Cydia splendana TaxID=1100963 RepID=UPI00300C76B7
MDIPANEEIFVGGDFNGHVGRMNVGYERVHGGFGFGSRNVQGEALLQAAAAFDLAIANTWFQKRDEHLITYKSGKHTTQIDYFLVKRNKINCIKDIKIIPGEHLTSQHRLLVIDLNIKVHILKRKERLPPKIRWKMLEKYECAKKLKERVIDKMIEMKDMEGLNGNECWKEMANCIRRVAKDVLGESKGKGIIDKETWWWNEEVQEILKQKKQAFREWQKVKAGQETEEAIKRTKYMECKKMAKRAVAIARTTAQDKLYNSLNSPQGEKQLYRLAKARERTSRDVSYIKCVKDDAGRVLTKDEGIRERWKGYFERLMNEENDWSRVLDHKPINMGAVREIYMDEVRAAVRSMKNGKSVGPDDIPGEVWKLLREDGCKWLTLFFNKLLHEETIPDEWCDSLLVPIFKNKGDVQECNNYRGIKLMSHSMKIWEKVIERRLRHESDITQNQFGFMPGRGTTDAIFALRQLCEKYRRAKKNLHMVFVDLEKAYDRVPREVLWWALKEKSVPGKYRTQVNDEMTGEREVWKKKTCCADPK